jgi:hypothetical protein
MNDQIKENPNDLDIDPDIAPQKNPRDPEYS